MNERIRELIAQATKVVEPNDPDYRHEIFDKEKFAELIVKECCFTGEQYADGLIDPKHYTFINKKIKEHFGVE